MTQERIISVSHDRQHRGTVKLGEYRSRDHRKLGGQQSLPPGVCSGHLDAPIRDGRYG